MLRVPEMAEDVLSEDEGYELTINSNADTAQPSKNAAAVDGFTDLKSATDTPAEGPSKRFFRFFFHTGIPSFCVRHGLLSIILIGFGMLSLFQFPNVNIGPFPLPYTLLIVGWSLLSIIIILSVLHMFVVLCHGRRLFYNWSFIHYISELETYIALMVFVAFTLVALSFDVVQAFTLTWVFGSDEVRRMSIKVFLGLFLTSALMALKRHFMTALAMSFNYSNYKDRIQESLFADKILNLLQKSRHTYKFRQKWRVGANENAVSTGKSVGRGVVKSGQLSPPTIKVEGSSVRSAMEIFASSATSKGVEKKKSPHFSADASIPASPVKVQLQQTSPGSVPERPLSPTTPSTPVRSVAAYLTESDKKQQFMDFFRLANKMLSRFSNGGDYRQEIQNEANRLSTKLYKYLRSYDRDCLLGQDLLPYIEDESEFVKAVILIKRHVDGSYQNSSMAFEDASSYAFSASDLQRAIDGILTELYVTAKSLQIIETALGKVDTFFSILVGLVMIIIVAILLGDAVKLLLALSTMLSAAAFAFGTSARNMFESMIFLLVIHPFDVGDRVFIPLGTTTASLATTAASMSGVDALDNLIVSETHLLSTVFERWDGVKLYVPNYVLASKPIFNIRRSGPLMEMIRVQVDFATPLNKIEELRKRMEAFVRKEPSDYTEVVRVLLDSMENCNKITVNLYFQHTTNWQDMDTQLGRRSKMLSWVKEACETLEITYLPPVQRVALVGPGMQGSLLSGGEVNRLLEMSKVNGKVLV